MDPPKTAKPPLNNGISQNPFVMKLLLIVGGVLILMGAGAFLINTFYGDKTNLNDVLGIVQEEQEILRISEKLTENTAAATKNATASTKGAVTSQQQEWLVYLAQHGRKKIPAKELSLKQNTSTDKRLSQAQATSTFDITYRQVMRAQLEGYAASLKSLHAKSSSKKEKALLAEDYNEVQLLLEQWPAATP